MPTNQPLSYISHRTFAYNARHEAWISDKDSFSSCTRNNRMIENIEREREIRETRGYEHLPWRKKKKEEKKENFQNSISNQAESYLHPPSLLPCSVSRRLRRLTTTNRFSILTVPRYQINREILLVI